MPLDLKDYFRTFYDDQLTVLPMPIEAHVTGATRLLEKRSEMEEVEQALAAQKEEFQIRMESARQRKDNLTEKKEQQKEQLIKFDAFLKENDSKCSRAKKKASADKELARQKELEIERLEQEITSLQARKQVLQEKVQRSGIYWEFLNKAIKGSKKFEEIRELLGRTDTLLLTRDQLLQKDSEGQERQEYQRLQLRRFVEEQGNLVLLRNNQLSTLQTKLDHARMQAFKWESTWNHIQSTAAKETLLLGQIKVVTLNLFHMMGGFQSDSMKGVRIRECERCRVEEERGAEL
ncbi:hypothetical protein SKAU_G00005970 [Synaphobranchus kaupii]|uniref:DUF4200 domain-containing protein n=1 Tax=Synaphobranchus kaupii TaxID=118154 RepID=A0A9Q1G917_SYNKA|nr:hypothetical protein SKAU_G00005970 [Synaphobranchus kaupii]